MQAKATLGYCLSFGFRVEGFRVEGLTSVLALASVSSFGDLGFGAGTTVNPKATPGEKCRSIP